MTLLERLKLLLGITGTDQDALLAMLLDEARDWITDYTGRYEWPSLPARLLSVQTRLAAMYYNRRGIEGMSSAGEGGVNRQVDHLPQDIQRALNMYRVARVLGTRRSCNDGGGTVPNITSTDQLPEGLVNLYYADARVAAYLAAHGFEPGDGSGGDAADIDAAIATHDQSTLSHADIRTLIAGLTEDMANLADDGGSGGEPPDIAAAIVAHDLSDAAHADIRVLIDGLRSDVDVIAWDLNALEDAEPPDIAGAIAAHDQSDAAHADIRESMAAMAEDIDAIQSGGGSGGGHVYSEDEQLTGDTWIDGKPIYYKTTVGSFTGAGMASTYSVAIASGVDKLVDYGGWYSLAASMKLAAGTFFYMGNSEGSWFTFGDGNITFTAKSTQTASGQLPYQLWARYTKT